MSTTERAIPRFVRTADGAMELLKKRLAEINREDKVDGPIITDAYRLSSARQHWLVVEYAHEHHWQAREGVVYPQFDSARAITLAEALACYEF